MENYREMQNWHSKKRHKLKHFLEIIL